MSVNLENISEESVVMPALVRLYDSQKDLSQSNSSNKKTDELTSIITSLLEMELSPKESELVADVLISLMRQIEHDMRHAIAEQLSVMETVPLRLALHMANDDIHIARPVLTHSKVFSDMDLVYIIRSKTSEYWQAIAKRESMSEEVMDILADTGDFDTALNLVENKSITLSDHTINALVDLGRENDEIAGPLMRRDEATEDIVKTLYHCVGMALKHQIREEFEMFEGDIDDIVEDVTIQFVEAADWVPPPRPKGSKGIPSDSHMKVAERYQEKELLTIELMLKTLKRGQYQSFVAQFSLYLGLPRETVHQIICQKSGQGLAVACRAAEIERSNFISIYLLGTRLRSKGGMVDVKDLKRASRYFDKIDRKTAIDILKSSQKSERGFLQ